MLVWEKHWNPETPRGEILSVTGNILGGLRQPMERIRNKLTDKASNLRHFWCKILWHIHKSAMTEQLTP